MKRTLLFALMVGVGLWMAGIALAGDYHVGAQLQCSQCHTMHYSITHDWTTPALGGSGPYANLLRNDANTLCLSCHDGQGAATGNVAPDVFEANYATANVRQAGALNATTSSGTYTPTYGHTLGATSAEAPGGTWTTDATVGLTCVNCHDAHGVAAQYRNLKLRPGNASSDLAVTYGTSDTANSVKQTATTPTSTQYSWTNIKFNEPSGTETASAYAAWCQGCHTNFHGSANVGSAGARIRHPAADANLSLVDYTRYSGLTNKVQVMYDTATLSNTATPSCFSCHKGHGNGNPFGLIYMSGTGTVTEQGDGGAYRDLCRQCHSQGG